MDERQPNRLHALVLAGEGYATLSADELKVLEKPPRYDDIIPDIGRYVERVRSFQKRVREDVRDIALVVTEADGHEPEVLFSTDYDAVYNEFVHWGLSDRFGAGFLNTGHQWVTVSRARFRNDAGLNQQVVLDELKAQRDELKALYRPVGVFVQNVDRYVRATLKLKCSSYEAIHTCATAEYERADTLNRLLLSRTNSIRKTVLSVQFVNSLLHRLEESTKHHPGD